MYSFSTHGVRQFGERVAATDCGLKLHDHSWVWILAGNCSGDPSKGGVDPSTGEVRYAMPPHIHLWARGVTFSKNAWTGKTPPPTSSEFGKLIVRCRRCRNCAVWRGWKWANRMTAECASASRTWFITLTSSSKTVHKGLDRALWRFLCEDLSNYGSERATLSAALNHAGTAGEGSAKYARRLREMTLRREILATAVGGRITAVPSISDEARRELRRLRERLYWNAQVDPFLSACGKTPGLGSATLQRSNCIRAGTPTCTCCCTKSPESRR